MREPRVRESVESAREARSVNADQLGVAAMIVSGWSECLMGEVEKAVNGA